MTPEPDPALNSKSQRKTTPESFRKAVLWVAILNLAYFVVEFVAAQILGSVSLFADSIDFVEDGLLNLLIFFASVWTLARRARVGHVLAIIVFVPAVATLVTAIVKALHPEAPSVVPLSVTAVGALLVNLACAAILVTHRAQHGSLARAAWLSARNDAFANILILIAAAVTLAWASGWPDIAAGVIIAYINADAGFKVWRAAQAERLEAKGTPQP